MSRRNNFSISDFYCVECGHQGLSLPRNHGFNRESGHLKKIYCTHCNKETNHAEIRDNSPYKKEDFFLEFECGRFVDGKRVEIADLIGCSFSECQYNIHGKCWNANKSFDCGHRR